jgi:hypothetical protein
MIARAARTNRPISHAFLPRPANIDGKRQSTRICHMKAGRVTDMVGSADDRKDRRL